MIISVINHTNGQLSDEQVQGAIRAINRQIKEDFEPYWSLGATLRLEGKTGPKPKPQESADLRGDAVLYLWNNTNVPNALGYHERNNSGIPFGFVFTELSAQLGEHWTVTLSHEALELIADPEVNLLVMGPHPSGNNPDVFHWYEMCDAVQAETYRIDEIDVSNFVLPLYFTGGEEVGGRNDFLGRLHDGKTLRSFGVNPGGYVGFFNPQTGEHETFSRKGDTQAEERMKIKLKGKAARRAIRYQRFGAKRHGVKQPRR
ncbi:MAG: hypothetical protein A3F90_12770 [Deltaproteobacteria bacterium RIFCSPLOWO2_12_FULL_60_19]|nr:MAG: hypothetical protein A3F90_12770 [Deltaproteobacteria bacterium RIFCSPLOWO2_12_FULL_60_19]